MNGIKPVKDYLYNEMKEKGYISIIKSNSIKMTKNVKNSKSNQNIQIDKLFHIFNLYFEE